MSLFSRIAKKIRRRFRAKGTSWNEVNSTPTTAEKLISNNWNIAFKFTKPKRAGELRAYERLSKKLKANEKISSYIIVPSRQVIRATGRRKVKDHRMLTTNQATRR